MLRRFYKPLFILLLILSASNQAVWAAGTPASSLISNSVTLDYIFGGVPRTASATSLFTVAERLEVNLTWQDASNVTAIPPSNNRVLTFLLTNSGNGIDQYLLAVDGAVAGDDFDIAAGDLEIWIDDGSGLYEPANDTLYTGANGPILNGGVPGNDAVILFVVADVLVGPSVGELADIQLTATSQAAFTAGEVGNVGAEITGGGDGGVDALVGVSGGQANATGRIEIEPSGVVINKTVTVIDTLGGNDPHIGATLRYTLNVQVSGSNNIDNLIITDAIPANTTYTPNSLVLDSVAQTDASDAPGTDFSDFNTSNANAITVDLSQGGAVSISPPTTFIIEFEVTID